MDTLDLYTRIFSSYWPKVNPSCIVELGARDCGESLRFHEKFPQADIYAFECNEATLGVCRTQAARTPKIHLIEKAVTDYDGFITFFPIDQEKTVTVHKDGNPGASSIFKANGNYPRETYAQKETKVPCTSLATFVKEVGIKEVDLLWMDIQGAELLALRGMGDAIECVKSVHAEVHFVEIYEGQAMYKDMDDFLKSKGFVFAGFTSMDYYFGDAVYLNRRYLSSSQLLSLDLNNVVRNITQSAKKAARRLLGRG